MKVADAYTELKSFQVNTAYYQSLGALAGWDQRTYIPRKGHDHRARQFAALAQLLHQRRTDPRIGYWLESLAESNFLKNDGTPEAVNVREWRRAYERIVRVPEDLVVALARAQSEGESAWEEMHRRNDWNGFRPHLERLVGLTREYAEAVGYETEAYDALLEDYEPGERAARLQEMFAVLGPEIKALLEAVLSSPRQPPKGVLERNYPIDQQIQIVRHIVGRIGYDLDGGRIDPTTHPFELSVGPGDVRITTRYYSNYLGAALFGGIHEAGHAIYEQGLPAEHWGTPIGEAAGMGVHESQSRLWENAVGRSLGFWRHFFPLLQTSFSALSNVSLDDFHRAVNAVKPSLIRVEADELTYNLHIMIRFELELALFRGQLEVSDLPGAWNEKYIKYLGVEPEDYKNGVMQDVHWGAGLFGYFPTYTLGNVYAAELYQAAGAELGSLEDLFARGEFAPLLTWLRKNVHIHGRRYLPRELIARASGGQPNAKTLINYLKNRFAVIYAI